MPALLLPGSCAEPPEGARASVPLVPSLSPGDEQPRLTAGVRQPVLRSSR